MTTLRDLLNACDAEVRAHLETDEVVLATGRCEDVTERGDASAGGNGWTYVMITNRKLRWVPHLDLRFAASLDLDEVASVKELSLAHRYAITLEHPPLARPRHVPRHRVLTFRWGNAVGTSPLRRTVLAFSRRETEAARALREPRVARGPRVRA